jgi:DNA modification methylase
VSESFLDGKVTLHRGDCLEVLPLLEADSIDSCVTDPPYHLTSIVKRFGSTNAAPCQHGTDGAYARASKGFMGKQWDGGDIAFRPEIWAEVLRVLKPGAHLLAFSSTRTYHRMACAIEDAGFEIRDQIGWCYGSGFPKSHNVGLAIDKVNGAEHRGKAFNMKGRGERAEELDANGNNEWGGWGTALKPAWEPICLARKPLSESSIAANVLKHGTGGINVDGCRVGIDGGTRKAGPPSYKPGAALMGSLDGSLNGGGCEPIGAGRWPANLIHDGSEEVLTGFPESGETSRGGQATEKQIGVSMPLGGVRSTVFHDDSGSAARFFYTAKADQEDRLGSKHPTVKPLDLIQYLVRLVTPKGGTVLDPFAGTGTAGEAAYREGVKAVLIEREEEYQADIVKRMGLCLSGPDERRRETIKAAGLVADAGPLFGGTELGDKNMGRQIYGVYADEKGGRGRRG